MKARKLSAAIAMVALACLVGMAGAGNQEMRSYTLFGGSDTDSLEQLSPWIPVRGAIRVYIRTWSGKAAFHASTDADSTFSDSIAIWKVGFSDSMLRTNPLAAGDSVVVTSTIVTNTDTTSKMVGVSNPPLQEALRGPGNGSGIITTVWPTVPGLATLDAAGGTIVPQYMRVYVTPLRRNTVTGGQSTEGKRVVGLKKFRMEALVLFRNR